MACEVTALPMNPRPRPDDFLAQLTVKWEDATKPVEELGVRRVIARNAVVLARNDGLFPLMALAPRLFLGGRFGDGKQAMPWIHLVDQTNALRFLLDNENARGPYNLISPAPHIQCGVYAGCCKSAASSILVPCPQVFAATGSGRDECSLN